MKRLLLLTSLVLSLCCVHAQDLLDERFDLSVQQASLEEALLELKTQTGVNFAYSNDILSTDKRMTLEMRQLPLKKLLEQILKNTAIEYKVVGRQIVLFRKQKRPTSYTISGYITDRNTGDKLISANIFVPGTRKGTSTNSYGFYSITLDEGPVKLKFSYLGYQEVTKYVDLKSNLQLLISLSPSLTLSEVVVIARDSINIFPTNMSTDEIPLGRFKTLPALGGEVDVIRLAHLLPGVQTGADGVGGVQIRGGSADQNLVLLDGVPVYNPAHMVGVFSIFNSSAINSTRLIKGSFPARYGGRLSSVLDIRTKEGNKKRLGAEATIGLTSAKVSIEGPIKQDTSSFIFSARQSFLGFYIRPISRRMKENNGQQGESDYNFYDLNGKVNLSFSSKDALYLSFYNGGDRYDNSTNSTSATMTSRFADRARQALAWGNTIATLRWNHQFSSQLFSNTTLAYSRYAFESEDLYTYTNADLASGQTISEFFFSRFNSEIEDLTFKIDFDYVPSLQHYLRFGASVIHHRFRPGLASLYDDIQLQDEDIALRILFLDTLDNSPVNNLEYELYIEDDIRWSSRLKTNIGVRASMLSVSDENYFIIQPRVAANYRLNRRLQLKASVSLMSQYLHLLTSSSIGLPNDLWVPSTDRVKPQTAWQWVLGASYEIGKQFVLDLEGYYKRMNNVITFQEGGSISFINADNWENNVTAGQGWSYGTELFLRKDAGRTTGWFNYTLAWSTRQFDEVNLGRNFPFRYDRRHSFKLALVHKLSNNWDLSGNWVYETGIAVTLPISEYIFDTPDFSPAQALNFGEKNGFRMPANHRLDVGCNYHFSKKLEHTLSFGVYNLTNSRNPLYYRLSRDPQNIRERTYIQATLLPIMPYFSYTIRI
ncbi:MAG: TonB-dependent receptor [Bacteroidota bacterium]